MYKLLLAAVLVLISNPANTQSLPANAKKYLPILQEEKDRFWPEHPRPATLGAQVEQETCVRLTHSKCWSPYAELRTSREQGVGLGQITRAFFPSGKLRFDALDELRRAFPDELKDFSWNSNLYDPRLQLRALVLKDLQGYRLVQKAATEDDALAFTYAAYNGGFGGLSSDRKACAATRGCDSSRWFGHVEYTSLKAKKSVDGYKKSFFEINREYVKNVMHVRRARYDGQLK